MNPLQVTTFCSFHSFSSDLTSVGHVGVSDRQRGSWGRRGTRTNACALLIAVFSYHFPYQDSTMCGPWFTLLEIHINGLHRRSTDSESEGG